MDNIVVMAKSKEEERHLLECLRLLFPECEIKFISRHWKDGKRILEAIDNAVPDVEEERDGKYLDYR